MEKNMGQTDRTVRTLIGGVLLVYGILFQNPIGAIGLIPLATGLIGYCPLYTLLGITTNPYAD